MADGAPVLVVGGTGAQGGATIDALLAAGRAVRALVRDADAPAARRLAARGVALAVGDFDDAGSLARAASGAVGLFSVQMPPRPGDADSEIRAGRRLIEAASAAGVRHVVHTSVARAGDHARFAGWAEGRWWPDYWTAKAAVNDIVRSAGLPRWTILKPAFMIDNFVPPKAAGMFPSLRRGVIETAMDVDARLDLIAAADIGRVAAAAFVAPDRFHAQEIDLAAESLTIGAVAALIARATGRPVTAQHLPAERAIAAGNHAGLVESQRWASVEGYRVDLARSRSWGVALESMADWTMRHRAAFDVGDA